MRRFSGAGVDAVTSNGRLPAVFLSLLRSGQCIRHLFGNTEDKPLSKSISKGNTPHSGGATPCTDLQGWPFALLSEKSGISPSMVVFPRQLRRGFFLAAFWQQCAARRKQFSSCETPPSFPAGVYPRVCRAFLRAHPCGAFREGRFPYPSFASSYWVSRPSGRAFTRLRSMLIRILNAKPFAVTGLRNPRVSMLGRRTPIIK